MAIKRVKRRINGKLEWCYVFDIYVENQRGEQERKRTPRGLYFPTYKECEEAVAIIRADIRRGVYNFGKAKKPPVTISQLAEKWIASLEGNDRKKGYIQAAVRIMKAFETVLENKLVADVTTSDIQAFAKYELTEGRHKQAKNQPPGKHQGTVKQELTMVHICLNAGRDLFKELESFIPPRKPKLGLPDSNRDRVITEEEEAKIIAAYLTPRKRENIYYKLTREQGARIFWFAIRTGLRAGEIIGLRRTSVVFASSKPMPHGYIFVQEQRGGAKTKTGKIRKVPMTPSLVEMLKEQLARHKSDYVFPSIINPVKPLGQFYTGFIAACKVAGLPYGRLTPGGIVFHDTRHTAITRMLENGAALHTVASMSGHSNQSMTMRYAHVSDQRKHDAAMLLDTSGFPSP